MVTALKLERVRRSIKQWRLASLVGISQTELSHYEVGRRRCPADMRYRIAAVLEVKTENIFPEDELEHLEEHAAKW